MLNDIFDHIYCINLARRTDRKLKCIDKFNSLNMEVEFFNAIDGKGLYNPTRLLVGEYGAALSHLAIIKTAKSHGYKRILVMEDDVEFHPNFRDLWDSYYQDVPADWQMLYGGANHETPCIQIAEHAAKCTKAFTLHFVGIDNTIYDKLIDINNDIKYAIDVHYANLHKTVKAYSIIPHLVFQEKDYSDIQNQIVDYTVIRNHIK